MFHSASSGAVLNGQCSKLSAVRESLQSLNVLLAVFGEDRLNLALSNASVLNVLAVTRV